jgi:glycosyltransferase involved in cell wall biosynthesis
LIARLLARGGVVHTPSSFVAEEVRDHFRAPREAVVAVHSGIPTLPAPDASTLALDLARPYVLAVGTAEPRKDLPGLVRAFERVAHEVPDLDLVLAGPPGWGSAALDEAIAASSVAGRIIETGYVDGPALAALLGGARVLAYPSLYEGFGFPPLQAMAAGVPVVVTRAGALMETVGDACLDVAIGDVDALAEAIVAAVTDEALRTILIAAGRARVADFSWSATADGLVDIYRRVAAR